MKKKRRFYWVFYGLVLYVAAWLGLIVYIAVSPAPTEPQEYHQTAPSNMKIYNEIAEYIDEHEDELTADVYKEHAQLWFEYHVEPGCSAATHYGFYYSKHNTAEDYNYDFETIRLINGTAEVYKNGRSINFVDDYYTQQIKDNWFYYEFWDG